MQHMEAIYRSIDLHLRIILVRTALKRMLHRNIAGDCFVKTVVPISWLLLMHIPIDYLLRLA